MTIHAISLFIVLYVLLRLVLPLPFSLPAKAALALPVLLISQFHSFNRLLFGGLASPELPQPLPILFGWLFISLLLLFILLLLKDAASLLLLPGRLVKPGLSLPGSPQRWAAALTALAMLLSAYGVWQAVRAPGVRHREITLPRLPGELDGLVIAHVTDLHASRLLPGPRVRAVVERVNAMKPDLILMSGDLVDGTPANRAKDVAPLGELRAPYGVFSCPGNHEYFFDFPGWLERLAALGVTTLNNAHTVLSVKGQKLLIAGVSDEAARRYGLPLPNLAEALDKAPEDATRILLEHRPGKAPDNAAHGIDLQLSGHTHGGHIRGMDLLVARFNNGFVSGLYELDGMRLYVSNGAGLWNGFPVRLGVPAEVTRIVLRSPAP